MPTRFLLVATLVLLLVWLALARAPGGALAVGAVAIVAALWTLRRTAGARGTVLRLRHLPRLAVMFLWQSIAGGVDVARRILSPAMPLRPGLITLRLALHGEGARVLLALLVSLMPGTLAARLDGDALTLHVLDLDLPIESETRRIEQLIGRVYGADEAPGP